jgi:hypothetical protein
MPTEEVVVAAIDSVQVVSEAAKDVVTLPPFTLLRVRMLDGCVPVLVNLPVPVGKGLPLPVGNECFPVPVPIG